MYYLKDLEAWIFSICLNIIRKHFRKLATEKRHLKKFTESYLDSDSSTVNELEYRDLLEIVDKIIKNLPPRMRTIFLLSKKESLSNLEIASELNISVRTVENQLSKGKSIIKEALYDGNIVSLLFFFLFIN